ncbi:MAG: ABC transporter ATP-binding protein [Candidatus Methylomirabilia bacterium]
MDADLLLDVRGLVSGYGRIVILHGVSLSVGYGEMISVIGPNGAGKSTAMKAIFGLLALRAGSLRFDGKEVGQLRPQERLRRGLSYVPQGRSIWPLMTVRENLELGAFIRRDGRIEQDIARVYERFPVLGDKERALAGTLSGGQQKMLEIGRALMLEPKLLMLDEPSLGLAPRVIENLFEKLVELKASGMTLLMVEQNARRALEVSDRGYVLELGRNRFEDTGPRLLQDPQVRQLYLGG